MVIHEVIEPRETRRRIIAALEFFQDKNISHYPKKHGNMPL
jgi:acetyl-CoA carboxylase carboxyltransferase component